MYISDELFFHYFYDNDNNFVIQDFRDNSFTKIKNSTVISKGTLYIPGESVVSIVGNHIYTFDSNNNLKEYVLKDGAYKFSKIIFNAIPFKLQSKDINGNLWFLAKEYEKMFVYKFENGIVIKKYEVAPFMNHLKVYNDYNLVVTSPQGSTIINATQPIAVPTLAVTSFKANLVSPQNVGTAIQLSALGTGQGTLKYRFCVNDGTNLKVLQDYSTSSNITWTPTKAGTYTVSVGIMDSTGTKVFKKFDYIIKSVTPLAIKSFKANLVSPQTLGTTIQLSAIGAGEGTLMYRFCVNDGTKLTVMQNFTSKPSVAWTPTKAGTYTVSLGLKDSTGKAVYSKFTYIVK